MAEDYTNIRLSGKTSLIADRVLESGLFEDKATLCKFAFAYAIKNHRDEINADIINAHTDSNGSNYSIGTLDADKYLAHFVIALHPEITAPYRYIRAVMVFGLEMLGDRLDAGTLYPISDLL